jgi:hypothetical protein
LLQFPGFSKHTEKKRGKGGRKEKGRRGKGNVKNVLLIHLSRYADGSRREKARKGQIDWNNKCNLN